MGRKETSQNAARSASRRWLAAGVVAVGVATAGAYLVLWRGSADAPDPDVAVDSGVTEDHDAVAEKVWRRLRADLDRPHVILVTIDTLRADHLGCYGGVDVDTPHLDTLASEGVRFANAASTVPFTLPAHSSIMTGTYPPYHGVRENVGYFLDEGIPTLAEQLGSAGYATAGFVSAFVLDARWGIARGFGEYFDDFDVASREQIDMGSVQRAGEETIAEAVRWLDRRPSSPFFLWLHLFDPHEPYTPPEPFRSRYPRDPYAAEVAYTDTLIGGFRDALTERGLLEESLLILTGDHGEGRGHHREVSHGFYVYDSTVHIPLIVRLPRGEGGQEEGRVVSEVVSHVDILPTVLAATGLAPPAHAQGVSLLPYLLDLPAPAGRAVYSESYYSLFHYGWAPSRAIRTAEFKFIDTPRPELYNLRDDQPEEHNLIRDQRRVARDLKQRLDSMRVTIDRPAGQAAAQPDLDEETLQQLRALGYVAGRGEISAADEDAVVRADPKDRIVVHQSIMAAQGSISKGDEETAEKRLKKVLEIDDGVVDVYQMLGSIATQRGELEPAIDYYKRALEIDSDHHSSLFGLANAYRRLERLDEALVGFKRLHTLAPHDSKAAVAMADIYVGQGKLDDALVAIDQAASSKDAAARVHNKHGELLVLIGRAPEAVEKFRRAIETNDQLAEPHFNLAVLAADRGEYQGAVAGYQEAIRLEPKHFRAQFNLGRLYGQSGRSERQQELFEAAIDSNPQFVRGYYYLAKLLLDRGGDLARAEELTRKGLELDPESEVGPLGYFLLTDILNRRGRREEAQQALRQGQRIQAASE